MNKIPLKCRQKIVKFKYLWKFLVVRVRYIRLIVAIKDGLLFQLKLIAWKSKPSNSGELDFVAHRYHTHGEMKSQSNNIEVHSPIYRIIEKKHCVTLAFMTMFCHRSCVISGPGNSRTYPTLQVAGIPRNFISTRRHHQ